MGIPLLTSFAREFGSVVSISPSSPVRLVFDGSSLLYWLVEGEILFCFCFLFQNLMNLFLFSFDFWFKSGRQREGSWLLNGEFKDLRRAVLNFLQLVCFVGEGREKGQPIDSLSHDR